MTRSEAITALYALFNAPHNADINLAGLNVLLDELYKSHPQEEPHMKSEQIIHSLAVGIKSIQSRVIDRETDEVISFVKIPIEDSGLVRCEKGTKEMNNEPVAIRYDFDGYGYQYIDSGSGSDWQTRVQGEPLYTTPKIEVGCAECGVNGGHALYCVECAEKFVGEAATKLQQKQETIEGLNRDYDLLFAEHQLLLKKEWVGLMRGVRVEGDTLVITVKGGNDAARELCGALIEEMNK